MLDSSAIIKSPEVASLYSTSSTPQLLIKEISLRNVIDLPFITKTKTPFPLPSFIKNHNDLTGRAFRHELKKIKKLDKKRELCKSGLENELQQVKVVRRAEKNEASPVSIAQQLKVLKKKHLKVRKICEKSYDITLSDKNFKHVTAFRRQIIADIRNIEMIEKKEKLLEERHGIVKTLNARIDDIGASGINNGVKRFNNISDNIEGEDIIRKLHNDKALCTKNTSLAEEFIRKSPYYFRESFRLVINYCEKLGLINERLLTLYKEV
ncbi:hypothetical protein [Pantoea cypripedii]|uniref:Uncharacterized protein n=1 Tax=Pantoea cypripedii TaxID=55209 RepID=A0A6B9G3Z7_PANCY|nr:hypothetical protein [Pantoea cypripedii]QGY32224.1 hypothetical protein CUN67_24850 [Pantoea cypripedii]